jgi:hypothetical protein
MADPRSHGTGDRTHEAAELVQAAALEAIKAMKAFLEVAEAVVREPGTAATVGRAFAEAATSAFRPPSAPRHDEDDADEEQHTGRVRRIDLSD